MIGTEVDNECYRGTGGGWGRAGVVINSVCVCVCVCVFEGGDLVVWKEFRMDGGT